MTGDPITVELAPDLAQVAIARRLVRSHLDDIDECVSADAQLITSELVTNAIEHGAGGPVLLSFRTGDDDVVVSVACSGGAPNVGPVDDWRIADVDEIDGRGLGIVRAVASEVDVSRCRGRLVISARITR